MLCASAQKFSNTPEMEIAVTISKWMAQASNHNKKNQNTETFVK